MRLSLLLLVFPLALFSQSDSTIEINSPTNSNCRVTRMFEHSVGAGRCFGTDEVMVGIQTTNPLVVRCARLQVRCQVSLENTDELSETHSSAQP